MANFHAREMPHKVAVGHPKFAVVVKSQTDLLLFISRDITPLGRSAKNSLIRNTLCINHELKNNAFLTFYLWNNLFHKPVGPSAVPFNFIAPRVPKPNKWNFSRHFWCFDVYVFDFCNAVGVSFDQSFFGARLKIITAFGLQQKR
jgi:hypothetical protein